MRLVIARDPLEITGNLSRIPGNLSKRVVDPLRIGGNLRCRVVDPLRIEGDPLRVGGMLFRDEGMLFMREGMQLRVGGILRCRVVDPLRIEGDLLRVEGDLPRVEAAHEARPAMLESMIRHAKTDAPAKDQRFLIHGVSFEAYETIREVLDENAGLRMTYLDGMLELMSPGETHETKKSLFARLLELYALEKGIDIYPYGSMTLKKKQKKAGLEPDESYTVGAKKKVPDFAFEAVVTNPGIKKLKAYKRFGVTEVLFWKKGRFRLYRLVEGRYRLEARSRFFPELDWEVVASSMESPKPQIEVLREFRAKVCSV